MNLLTSTFLACLALSLWIEPGLTRVAKRRPGEERDLFVVTQALNDDSFDSRGSVVVGFRRPAHSWLVLTGTTDEGPMRVELVNPQLRGSRGLAISIRQYPVGHSLESDLLGSSPSPDRAVQVLPRPVTLSNTDFFDLADLSNSGQPPRSIVVRAWVRCAMDHMVASTRAPDDEIVPDERRSFGSSHDFVDVLLATAPLTFSHVDWKYYKGPNTLLRMRAEMWADRARESNRDPTYTMGPPEALYSPIDHLFYRALKVGDDGSPSFDRMVFTLDKSFADYRPKRVTLPWRDTFERPERFARENRLKFNIHPASTSDQLPLSELGSLSDHIDLPPQLNQAAAAAAQPPNLRLTSPFQLASSSPALGQPPQAPPQPLPEQRAQPPRPPPPSPPSSPAAIPSPLVSLPAASAPAQPPSSRGGCWWCAGPGRVQE